MKSVAGLQIHNYMLFHFQLYSELFCSLNINLTRLWILDSQPMFTTLSSPQDGNLKLQWSETEQCGLPRHPKLGIIFEADKRVYFHLGNIYLIIIHCFNERTVFIDISFSIRLHFTFLLKFRRPHRCKLTLHQQ